jgi:hypothetical protein
MPRESYNAKRRLVGEIVLRWWCWTLDEGFAQVSGMGAVTDEDERELEEEGEDSATAVGEGTTDAPTVVWYAVPIWRFVVFVLVGGAPYAMYWMYRAWVAYRVSWGYSRWEQWRNVYARTGFRVSPAWRAFLLLHSYCLFTTVQREASLAGVRASVRPWPMFALVCLAFMTGLLAMVPPLAAQHLLLALAFLPAQIAINRLSARAYDSARYEPVGAAEILWVSLGVLQALLLSGPRSL